MAQLLHLLSYFTGQIELRGGYHMRIYQMFWVFFSETQLKLRVLKHKDLFPFHTQLFLYWCPESRNRTAAVVDYYTLISTYSCCSCTHL